MYYSYIEIEYVATSFSPTRTDLALKLSTVIADAQRKDQELKVCFKKNAKMPQKDIDLHLIEDTKVLCKNGKIIIPTSLRHMAVSWYHHYLQHLGTRV
jgi:hypothetical protein